MNWVFETYSNVYSTAMMQDMKVAPKAAVPTQVCFVSSFRPWLRRRDCSKRFNVNKQGSNFRGLVFCFEMEHIKND